MTGDTVGGVWTFTMELAEALGAHGIEVLLAALGGPPSRGQRSEAARVPNLKLLAADFKLEWMEDPWHDVEQSGQWLLDLEQRFAPDLVHLNSYGHGALPWSAPVVVTAHSCVLSWWAAVKGGTAPETWRRYRATVAQCLRSADTVAAPSRAMAAALAEHYGIGECRVVANGRNPARLLRAAKEPFVLTAGRLWDEAENAAAVALAARGLPWPVYAAGEHRDPGGRTARLDGCQMLGRLDADELAGWYARASIYALPARYQPFGLSALEAALSGCALVLGDIPSLREMWGDAAVFVPPHDIAALAGAVRYLIGEPRRRRCLARRALARARKFTPRRMAGEYLNAYHAAAARRSLCVS